MRELGNEGYIYTINTNCMTRVNSKSCIQWFLNSKYYFTNSLVSTARQPLACSFNCVQNNCNLEFQSEVYVIEMKIAGR
jgi:hypothetical protein